MRSVRIFVWTSLRAGAAGAVCALLSLTPSSSSAGPLRLSLGEVPCADRDLNASAIEEQFAALGLAAPGLTLVIGSAGPGEVQVSLVDATGQAVFLRTLALRRADCPVLPRVVALLVRGWLGRRWDSPPPLRSPPSPRTFAIREPVLVQPRSPDAPSRSSRPSWRLFALGGAFSAPARDQAGGSVQLAVDGPVDAGWGLGLAVGFDASLARRVNGGRIDASISSLAALVRWQALTDSPVSFAFLGGVGLEVVTVRAEGFTHNLRDSIPVASLRLGARCRWSITGPLGAILAADLALLAREERFNVIGYGRALTVSPVRARALAGFSLEF